MKSASEKHKLAMQMVEEALIAKQQGQPKKAQELYIKAFELEKQAAEVISEKKDLEPTRGILLRSAATLALDCGELREAEKLIGMALSGDPFYEIAEELRDILERINFERHLKLKGIKLQQNEFQFSLVGRSVGGGITFTSEFIGRVSFLENMIYRTAERKLEIPFRLAGPITKKMHEEIELFLSIPRAASFAVTFRIGSGEQLALPGMEGLPESVISEIFECLSLYNNDEINILREKIDNEDYFKNFVGLANNISPDGENIKAVGFTSLIKGIEQKVCISTPKQKLYRFDRDIIKEEESNVIEIKGTLLFADSRDEKKGIIEIEDEIGAKHKIKVAPGMMADIVRPMYEYEVIVKGRKKGKLIELDTIDKIN